MVVQVFMLTDEWRTQVNDAETGPAQQEEKTEDDDVLFERGVKGG